MNFRIELFSKSDAAHASGKTVSCCTPPCSLVPDDNGIQTFRYFWQGPVLRPKHRSNKLKTAAIRGLGLDH